MFEREAEEYYNGQYDAWLEGEEGYALEEEVEQAFKDGAEFGFNKANEWHYPSKGELPKCDEETQLMFYVNCYYNLGDKTVTRKRMVLGYYKKSFLSDDVKLFIEKSRGYEDEHLPQAVIAWKEIVLPEPPKY